MKGLSVITLTLNEEANIGTCLESVKWADELIIVDSGSTDKTVTIARQYGASVCSSDWEGYGHAKNRALTRVTKDWVLWLDADERVTPELADEIRTIVSSGTNDIAGYSVARRAYFLGRWIKHCGWYPARVVRLFRRDKGRFAEKKVHEYLILDGPVATLRHDLFHFTDPNLFHYFQKFNRYTSLAAEEMYSEGREFRFSDLFLRPFFTFVRMYFLRLGFLDGIHGLILCAASSSYVFTKYAKLWELEQK